MPIIRGHSRQVVGSKEIGRETWIKIMPVGGRALASHSQGKFPHACLFLTACCRNTPPSQFQLSATVRHTILTVWLGSPRAMWRRGVAAGHDIGKWSNHRNPSLREWLCDTVKRFPLAMRVEDAWWPSAPLENARPTSPCTSMSRRELTSHVHTSHQTLHQPLLQISSEIQRIEAFLFWSEKTPT